MRAGVLCWVVGPAAVLGSSMVPFAGTAGSSTNLGFQARRSQWLEDRDDSNTSHILVAREDYTCAPGRPCGNGACCGVSGFCGYGPTYCGDGCSSNCDAKAECGQYSESGDKTCPLNTCCSQYGFCGTTQDFCDDLCQSNCVLEPKPPGGSATGKTLSKVIGYYEAWNARSACHKTLPSELPLDALTHLNYAFAYLDPDSFAITTMDAATPVSLFDDFSDLKFDYPDLKLFVSIGGWTFSDNDTYTQPIFSNICSSASNRQKFADEALKFLNYYGFDGVDIDWEYPGAPDRGGKKEDTDNYVLMMKTLRETFDKSGRELGITFTAPSSYWYMQWFDLPGLMKYADWLNLMTYDLHGVWDSTNPIGSIVQGHTNLTEIKLATELLWRVDIQPHKVALGFGFYGRAFTLADPSCTEPGCPFSGGAKPGPCTATSGYLAYYEVQDILGKGSSAKRDINVIHEKEAAVKYFTWDTDQWISYDDAETFTQKIDWADDIGFSGSLIWASDLDDFESNAHAALTGKSAESINTPKTKKQSLDEKSVIAEFDSSLGKNCYKQPDAVTNCQDGDVQVGYDKAGKKGGDYLPVCCPADSGLTDCTWRGGTGGTNAGRDCNGQCHEGEVKVAGSSWGGQPGESGEGAHCTRGGKALCCTIGLYTDIVKGCDWTSGNGNTCDGNTQQKIAYMSDRTGDGTPWSHGSEYCCPKDKPAPLTDCHWVGSGDCADNTCSSTEVTLERNSLGDGGATCHWGRKKALCCTPNIEAVETINCESDLCEVYGSDACEDEAGYNDDDLFEFGPGSSVLPTRSYITADGRKLWTYDAYAEPDWDSSSHFSDLEKRAGGALPGQSRVKVYKLAQILGSSIYNGYEVTVASREYWPGLKSLYGAGSETLHMVGGYVPSADTCGSTVMKYVKGVDLPSRGMALEHIREINMIDKFVNSLITGKKVSGQAMSILFDPIAIAKGWNKVYDVSLPHLGGIITDPNWVAPKTLNDRVFEIIGSKAYRTGLSFLPQPENLAKRSVLAGFNVGGSPSAWRTAIGTVADSGSEALVDTLLTPLQKTIRAWNYLNDVEIGRALSISGTALVTEFGYAEQYLAGLERLSEAWQEWELDYYAEAVKKSTAYMNDRTGYIAQQFPKPEEYLTNPAVMKLIYEAAKLQSQIWRVSSPVE